MQFTITVSIEDVVPEKAERCPICETRELTKKVKATNSDGVYESVICSCVNEDCLKVARLEVVEAVLGWET